MPSLISITRPEISDFGALEFLDVEEVLVLLIITQHDSSTLPCLRSSSKIRIAPLSDRYPLNCLRARSPIVGNAGVFITRVIRVKKSALILFVVDGGMNDFARPALYRPS